MLFNSALLLCLIHGYRYSPPRYLVTCLRYHYPSRSTEHIRFIILLSYGSRLHRCSTVSRIPRCCQESTLSPHHLSLSSYPLVSSISYCCSSLSSSSSSSFTS